MIDVKLTSISAEKLIKILTKLGFEKIRIKGSHLFMRHPDGRTTIVPIHRGEGIGPGLLRKIINEIKINREEFLKLLND